MALYANFVCQQCRVSFFLGKAVREAEHVSHFWRGDSKSGRNSDNAEWNHVLWKMLADHAGHPLKVVVEGTSEYDEACEYKEIGGDTIDDISIEDYLAGWSG